MEKVIMSLLMTGLVLNHFQPLPPYFQIDMIIYRKKTQSSGCYRENVDQKYSKRTIKEILLDLRKIKQNLKLSLMSKKDKHCKYM